MDASRPKALTWINGTLSTAADAVVSADDRGFHFADGIYEVLRVYDGRPFGLIEHMDRLARSAAGIDLDLSPHMNTLLLAITELLPHFDGGDALIYIQATRGAATRNHLIPTGLSPTLVISIKPIAPMPLAGTAPGVKLLTVPDDRWKKCWIKSIALLPNVLARTAAAKAGCDEAIFDDDGILREGSTSNFAIVKSGRVITPPLHNKILAGVTRLAMLRVAGQMGVPIEERDIRREETADCDEAFITSTTREIAWVSEWDGRVIATECGPVTMKLGQALAAYIRQSSRSYSPPVSSSRMA